MKRKDTTIKCVVAQRKKKQIQKIEVSSEDSDSCIEHVFLNSIEMEEKRNTLSEKKNKKNWARPLDCNSKGKWF